MKLIYLSPVPLNSFAQRPHHFVEWFHRRFKAEVMWVEPGPSRLLKTSDWRRLRPGKSQALGPAWRQESWVAHLKFSVLPLEPLAWGRRMNRFQWRDGLERMEAFITPDTWIVVGKPCALAMELAALYPNNPLVFDAMDNIPFFFKGLSKAWMHEVEIKLAERADWILTSSTALVSKFTGHGTRVRKVLNGLTMPKSEPSSVPPIEKVVFGYVGVIASWFDWDAVLRLAMRNPRAEIRLIGPCDIPPPAFMPENIVFRPAIAQEQVYDAMREFTVGIIPFHINTLTDYVDPVKYYEYRAVGLPVLSTRFGEMQQRSAEEGVFFFEDLADVTSADELFKKQASADQKTLFCKDNNWDKRFDSIDFFKHVGSLRFSQHRERQASQPLAMTRERKSQ